MSSWSSYFDKVRARGPSKRDASLKRETRMIINKLPDNLSYTEVHIDGVSQNVAVINSDNYNEKTILSLPGEVIRSGNLIEWMNNYWLITELDANNTVYYRGKMLQCNHLLKWVDKNDVIHEQWCVIEDGTKYLTGEYENYDLIVARGDTRLSLTIAKNEFTSDFDRECRFIIDDPDSNFKLAYLLTKPLKLGSTYNNEGVFKFVLQEIVTTDFDNLDLGIADYYRHFPRTQDISQPPGYIGNDGKKVWL